MSDLTPKQARFVEEYAVDLNGTQAAIRAGYAEKSASVEAARLLANAKVGAAVSAALEARSKRTGINADWVLTRLAEEAEADIADLYDDAGNLKPVKEWPVIWRKGLVAGVDVLEEFETIDGKKERVGTIRKVKLSDRIKRIDLIGKHVDIRAFVERLTHENPDGSPLEAGVTDRELAKAVAVLFAKGMKEVGGSGV